MIPFLRGLYDFGGLIPPDNTKPVHTYMQFELATLELVEVKDNPAPRTKETRTGPTRNKPRPATFCDNHAYVMGGALQEKAFWDRTLRAVQESGDRPVAKAITEALKRRAEWPKGPDDKTYIPTYKGTPLLNRPRIRKWWDQQCAQDEIGKPDDISMLTGKPCIRARLHPKFVAPGTGQAVPLLSWKEPAFRYNGLKKGLNFPVGIDETRQYERGFTHILGNNAAQVSERKSDAFTLLIWPEGQVDHPIVSPALKLLGRWTKSKEAEEAWGTLQATQSDDDLILNMALIRGSAGRISVMNFTHITGGTLRENLLRFRQNFRSWSLNPTFRSVTSVRFLDGPDHTEPLLLASLAWAIALGASRPAAWEDYLLRHFRLTTPLLGAWLLDETFRPTTHHIEDMSEDMSEIIIPKPDGSYLNKDTSTAFLLGRTVALYCHFKGYYHYKKIKSGRGSKKTKVDPQRVLRTALTNPQRFWTDNVGKASALYRQNNHLQKDQTLQAQFDDIMAQPPKVPRVLGQRARANLVRGFQAQDTFCRRLIDWKSHQAKGSDENSETTEDA